MQSIGVLNNIGNFDMFISLPATAPLRSVLDVKRCTEALTDDVDMVLSCKYAERNPFFNMVKETTQGYVELVNNPEKIFSRRQEVPMIYDLTTVAYVSRPKFILESKSIMEGNTKAVIIPKERAVDIDDKWDFIYAETLMRYSNAY